MSTDTKDFYKNLPDLQDFQTAFTCTVDTLVPADWYILVSDVKNSTQAIESGKYKDVNMIGALTIISLLNIDKNIDIPFIFGGDGAFVLIPPSLLEESKQALLAVQKMGLDSYALHVRIGVVPVKEIYMRDKKLLLVKYKVSPEYSQAFVKGGGLELSDELVKNNKEYILDEAINETFNIDLTGLECRWEAIPTPKDETLSMLIKANDHNYYQDILKNLENILGTRVQRDPLSKNNMKLSFDAKDLNTEASLYTQNFFMRQLVILKFKFINVLGKMLMKFNVNEWSTYKQRIQSTTDIEKFDDILRLVAAATSTQRASLFKYLDEELLNKKLFYGIHSSDSSLMTCLIFQRHGKHIHFVDTSAGGYAVAAKMLKKQIEEASNNLE